MLQKLMALLAVLGLAVLALLYLGNPVGKDRVVVYTSVDDIYAKALADKFKAATGISVILRTDSEQSKTTEMLQRLEQYKSRPDGDVFWNSELAGTLLLTHKDLFEPYRSPQAETIPEPFKDSQGYWTGFGLRARVLIFNTQKLNKNEVPKQWVDLLEPRWSGRFCVARPMFGTTRSHFVALVLALGEENGFAFLNKLKENAQAGDPKRKWVVDGNSVVRDMVARGLFELGLTDTDDVYSAMERNAPVDLKFVEFGPEWPGVFLIPNTVSLIRNGPNQHNGQRFIDFLLEESTEVWLARQGARQIPVRDRITVPDGYPQLRDFTIAAVDSDRLRKELVELSRKIDALLRQ